MGITSILDCIEKDIIRPLRDCLHDDHLSFAKRSDAYSSLFDMFKKCIVDIPDELDSLSMRMDRLSITHGSKSSSLESEVERVLQIFSSMTTLLVKATSLKLVYRPKLDYLSDPIFLRAVFEPIVSHLEKPKSPFSCTTIKELYEALHSCLPIHLPMENTFFFMKNHGCQSLRCIFENILVLLTKETKKDPKTERPFEDLWAETLWKLDTLIMDVFTDTDLEKFCSEVFRKVHNSFVSLQSPLPKLKYLFLHHVGHAYIALNLKAPFPSFFSYLDKQEFTETICEEVFHELMQKSTYEEFKECIRPFQLKILDCYKTYPELRKPPFDVLFKSITRMIELMKPPFALKQTNEIFKNTLSSTALPLYQETRYEISGRIHILQEGNNGTEKVKRVYEHVMMLNNGTYKIVELIKVIDSLKKEEIGGFYAHARPTTKNIDICKSDFFHECEIANTLHPHSVQMILSKVSEKEYTLTMPYFNLDSLYDVIQTTKGFLPNDLTLARKIAENLLRIHEKGLLHLDVKPKNVLLMEEEREIQESITDYAFVIESNPYKELQSFMRMSYGFYPPEMFFSPYVQLSPSLDVWALGITLYYLLYPTSRFYQDSIRLQYLFDNSLNTTFMPYDNFTTWDFVEDLRLATKEYIESFATLKIIDATSKDQYLKTLDTVHEDEDRPKLRNILQDLYFALFRKKLKKLQQSQDPVEHLLGRLLEEDPKKRIPLKIACEELRRLEPKEIPHLESIELPRLEKEGVTKETQARIETVLTCYTCKQVQCYI